MESIEKNGDVNHSDPRFYYVENLNDGIFYLWEGILLIIYGYYYYYFYYYYNYLIDKDVIGYRSKPKFIHPSLKRSKGLFISHLIIKGLFAINIQQNMFVCGIASRSNCFA